MSTLTTRGAAAHHLLVVACAAVLAGGCAAGVFRSGPEDIPALEQQLAASPADQLLAARLGAAYFHAGRYQDALARLEPLAREGSTESAVYLYLGLTHEKLEDWGAARAAYTRCLELSPSPRTARELRERLALVSRLELRQQARELLAREQQLAPQPPTPSSIAVMPFAVSGLSEDLAPLQTALADMIVTDLSFTQLQAVERVRVQSILDEMRMGLGGVAAEGTAPRVGRLLRAEHVVQGSIAGQGEQLAIAAAVVNTARRTAQDAASREGQAEAIFDLEKQLVYDILNAVQYPLSPAERERIEENRVANLIAFLAYGRGLEALDRGDYAAARDQFQQAISLDPAFAPARAGRAEAQQLTDAQRVPVEQVPQGGSLLPPPPVTTLTQQLANELNPSLANSLAGQQQGGPPPGQERQNPVTENQPTPPLLQGAPATILLTVQRPGA